MLDTNPSTVLKEDAVSQLAQPSIPFVRTRSRVAALLGALTVALAAVALAVVLAAGSSPNPVSVTDRSQPALRADGGAEESAVAASVSSHPAAPPDESRIAASIATADAVTSSPDESRIAASIARR
jgi:hypothetical protein